MWLQHHINSSQPRLIKPSGRISKMQSSDFCPGILNMPASILMSLDLWLQMTAVPLTIISVFHQEKGGRGRRETRNHLYLSQGLTVMEIGKWSS